MRRHCLLLIIVVLFAVLAAGCGETASENKTPTPSPWPTEPLPTIKVYEPVYETSNKVVWMYNFFSKFFGGLNEKTGREINRILYERGLDCQIVFVDGGMVDGDQSRWEEQIEKYEKGQGATYGPIDILFTGIGGSNEAAEKGSFLKNRMAPLNDLLGSDEGKVLCEFYTQDEWMQVSLDGKTYCVPLAAYYSGEDEEYNDLYNSVGHGLFLSVREEYAEFFDGFDGTYASLRAIYNAIGDSSLHIMISGFDADIMYGLLGYSTMYDFPYRVDTGTAFDITKTDELPFLLMQLYDDMSSGILFPEFWQQKMSGEVLAYIHRNAQIPPEGYREYLLVKSIPAFRTNCLYGISAASAQKELAFRILSLCLTDPEILGLLYPGLQEETIERRTELLSGTTESELAGILLPKTDEKYRDLSNSSDEDHLRLDMAYMQMVNGMFKKTESKALDPRWNIEEEWKKYKEQAERYSGVCDIINQEVQDWLSGK